MPLTPKGRKILGAMRRHYPSDKQAEQVFYASINAGKVTGAEGRRKPGHGRASIAGYRRKKTA